METIGQRIKAMRERRGWTQGQLASAVGTSETYIGHWETGYRKPSMDSCVALADVLNTTLDELIRGTIPNSRRATMDGSNGSIDSPAVVALESVA